MLAAIVAPPKRRHEPIAELAGLERGETSALVRGQQKMRLVLEKNAMTLRERGETDNQQDQGDHRPRIARDYGESD
jgi:hypothetical protein